MLTSPKRVAIRSELARTNAFVIPAHSYGLRYLTKENTLEKGLKIIFEGRGRHFSSVLKPSLPVVANHRLKNPALIKALDVNGL